MFAHPRRRPGGFTLIELVVTVAILAVLAAAAVVAYNQFVGKSRVTAAAASAAALRSAITAKAAASDMSPDEVVAGLMADGGQENLLSKLSVDFDGDLVYQPSGDTGPATLRLAPGKGQTCALALPVAQGQAVDVERCTSGPAIPPGSLSESSTVTVGVVNDAAWSSTGNMLAFANYSGDKVTAVPVGENGQLGAVKEAISPYKEGPYSSAINADGTLLAVANNVVQNVSIYKVAADGSLSLYTARSVSGTARGVAFSPDGTLLAVGNYGSKVVSLFSVASTGAITAKGTYSTVDYANWLAFSPDGQSLAVTGQYAGMSVFKVTTTGALTGRTDYDTGSGSGFLSYNASGTLLVATHAKTVSLYPVQAGGTLGTRVDVALETTGSGLSAAVVNAAGTLMAVANYGTGEMQMFRMSGTTVDTDAVDSKDLPGAWWAAFNPTGTKLVGVARGGAVAVYDVG